MWGSIIQSPSKQFRPGTQAEGATTTCISGLSSLTTNMRIAHRRQQTSLALRGDTSLTPTSTFGLMANVTHELSHIDFRQERRASLPQVRFWLSISTIFQLNQAPTKPNQHHQHVTNLTKLRILKAKRNTQSRFFYSPFVQASRLFEAWSGFLWYLRRVMPANPRSALR